MKFCTKCGRRLQDGEVCSCQLQKNTDGQQTANTEQATTQQAAQTAAPQQAAKPIITKEQAAEISKGVLAYAKEFVNDPVGASEAVVGEHSLVTVAGLAVANAALELIYKKIGRAHV